MKTNQFSMSNLGLFGARVVGAVSLGILIAGCSGNTDGGSAADQTIEGSQFNGDNAGSITLRVNETEVPVSQTTHFSVAVADANGNPVPHIKVSCDTEKGLVLVEPTTGTEMTSSLGAISGILGCEAPGSLEVGCRLPIGGNKRQFKTVKCTGTVPAGFTGFPGAGGGGLNGGVSVPPGGSGGGNGSTTDLTRISSLKFYDSGALNDSGASTAIDVTQGTCGTTTPTPEPFFDTHIGVVIVNTSNSIVTFSRLKYTVKSVSTGATVCSASNIALTGDASVNPNGGTTQVIVPIFKANNNNKYCASGTQIPASTAFANVAVTLTGQDALGNAVSISATSAESFGNFDKCTS